MSRYAFVDGANFRLMMESTRTYYQLDQTAEFNFERFFDQTFQATRIFYYDALPAQKAGQSDEDYQRELDRVEKIFKTINACGGVHVKTGIARHRRKRGMEQKGVDILLALDAYRHAATGGLEIASLFTSDGDFYPVLEGLQNTPARTVLHCNRMIAPDYLTELADFVAPVNESDFVRFFSIGGRYLDSLHQRSQGSFTEGFDQIRANNLKRINSLIVAGENIEIWENADTKHAYAIRIDRDFAFASSPSDRTLEKLMEKEYGYRSDSHGPLRKT